MNDRYLHGTARGTTSRDQNQKHFDQYQNDFCSTGHQKRFLVVGHKSKAS